MLEHDFEPIPRAEWNSLTERLMQQYRMGEYDEATPLAEEALALAEAAFGPTDELIVTSLHNLGALYLAQGRGDEGSELIARALGREGFSGGREGMGGFRLPLLDVSLKALQRLRAQIAQGFWDAFAEPKNRRTKVRE